MDRLPIHDRVPLVEDPKHAPRPRIKAPKRVEVQKRPGGSREQYRIIGEYELYQLGRLGCTKDEAAQFFGLSSSGLSSRLHNNLELRLAWERGSAQAKIGLRRLQLRHAEQLGDAGVKMTIHMSKHQLGEVDTQVVTHAGSEANPIRVKVEREELIGRIVGNRTIEAGEGS
ncbi:MAG TPA: hypothetical protein VNX28_16240 [Gemmataceae bacterium]|jgi:hypothetical protein|nr:hypothetical protein [Gemmataceae bacterium]